MITLVLADDHRLVRESVRALLTIEPDFSIIGEAQDGLEAVRLVKNLLPDVVLVDLMMNGLNGIEVTREINQCYPQTKVVILSMCSNQAYVEEALKAGAKAYVLKESTSEELVRAVRRAIAGEIYLSAPLSRQNTK